MFASGASCTKPSPFAPMAHLRVRIDPNHPRPCANILRHAQHAGHLCPSTRLQLGDYRPAPTLPKPSRFAPAQLSLWGIIAQRQACNGECDGVRPHCSCARRGPTASARLCSCVPSRWRKAPAVSARLGRKTPIRASPWGLKTCACTCLRSR